MKYVNLFLVILLLTDFDWGKSPRGVNDLDIAHVNKKKTERNVVQVLLIG